MTNNTYKRSALIQAAMDQISPLIQRSLVKDPEFLNKYDLESDVLLTLGDSGITFQRSSFFDSIRNLLSSGLETEVADTESRTWKLADVSRKEDLPSIELRLSDKHFTLPDYSPLAPEENIRLRGLNKAASDVNLPNETRERWRNILKNRPLNNEEIEGYHNEIRYTPVHTMRSILSELEGEQVNISTLVPPSPRYFERLIGRYDGSASIHDYASGAGKKRVSKLSAWRPEDGFLISLFLSSHSTLTDNMNVDQLNDDKLSKIIDFLGEQGDKISQLGAIEVGLRTLPTRPDIESGIINLIEQIRGDNAQEKTSDFYHLSALFMLVYGEMSRIRLLSSKPPFYRKLAALSQAALIQRQCLKTDTDMEKFSEWCISNRGEQFYFQALADMRIEPRWNPDFAEPSQIKSDFFGRIMLAVSKYEEIDKRDPLHDLVLSSKPNSIHSESDFPLPYLPGPLEGTETSRIKLPVEVEKKIEEQIATGDMTPSSLAALVNSAMVFGIHKDQAELAADALKAGRYRLTNVKDRSQLLAILNGLASVAAVSRSQTLANELRILARRYSRDVEYALSAGEVVRICLVAAASHTGLDDWKEFVGDWLTEIAFSDLDENDGWRLYSHIQCLCRAVPELWFTCSRADAALKAYNYS